MNLKKPKFWDQKNPNLYAYLLYPFSILINSINFFKVEKNLFKSKLKTICVGNIYIGGTGKTSLSIKIHELLIKKNIKSCFVKKYYKNQIDEQNLLKKNGKLFLASKRIDALKKAEIENYEIAIMDDGLQDKSIKYDVCLVCFNNINWIGNGMTIPSGPLRENISNLKNYNHVFINGNLENLEDLKNQILQINSKMNIHVAKYKPTNISEFNKNEKYIAFSGIGNHKTFISMLKKYELNILKDIEFPDHYNFKNNDIKNIVNEAKKFNCKIITTEKDYMRLNNKIFKINFVKVELQIIDEDKLLKAII